MIPKGAFLKVVDNSGARLAQVIGLYGQTGQMAGIGDVVKVTVKEAKGEKITKGQMKKAVIIEAKKETHRLNGSFIQYMRNTCVLLSDKGAPLGNRIKSQLPYEFNKPRWKRISMLSKRLF
eukprot:gene10235-8152_t